MTTEIAQIQTNTLDPMFEGLARNISAEPGMFHTNAEALTRSCDEGLCAFEIQDDQIIGYARLVPLLDEKIIQAIGLDLRTPKVYELGSVYVHPDYRGEAGIDESGRKVADRVLDNIFATTKKIVDEGGVVIGTMVDVRMMKKLEGAIQHGIMPIISSHHTSFVETDEIGFLGALTCVCDDQIHGKAGVQFGLSSCRVRTQNPENVEFTAVNFDRKLIGTTGQFDEDGKLDGCYMFTLANNENLARLSATILNRYPKLDPIDALQWLINDLKQINYYGTTLS